MSVVIFMIVVLGITLGLALIPARFAEAKGHSFSAWYLFGVALWVPAIIASIWIKDPQLEDVPTVRIQRTDQTVAILSLVALIPVVLVTFVVGATLFLGQQVKNGYCDTLAELRSSSSTSTYSSYNRLYQDEC